MLVPVGSVSRVAMAVVLIVDMVAVLNRGVTAGLTVRVSTVVSVLGVFTAFMLIPMRLMLGVLVPVVHVIRVALVLHGGVTAIRAMVVTGVIVVHAMCGLRHERDRSLTSVWRTARPAMCRTCSGETAATRRVPAARDPKVLGDQPL